MPCGWEGNEGSEGLAESNESALMISVTCALTAWYRDLLRSTHMA